MGLPPRQLFAEIYEIHGHRCPMSTLGGRLGFAARQRLAGREPLTATYYIATCAADGISVMTGCSKATGTLRIVPQERHALWLQDADGRGIFAELSRQALHLAGEYRTRDQAFLKEETRLSTAERQERQRAKELLLEELLQKFWMLPDEELLNFAPELPADLAGTRD
jgi:formylmethanofuran dehydrogenase subunit E